MKSTEKQIREVSEMFSLPMSLAFGHLVERIEDNGHGSDVSQCAGIVGIDGKRYQLQVSLVHDRRKWLSDEGMVSFTQEVPEP